MKILFPPSPRKERRSHAIFAEVRSTNSFGHPGIAQISDCGIHGSGRAYPLYGVSARQIACGGPGRPGARRRNPDPGQHWWPSDCRACKPCTAKRMIHRALKTDSIFLTSAAYPVIKLLDFGLANFTQSVRHSQTGSLLGAPLYMSPEVGRGLGNVDHRADIYSLGCILFEMATGRPPFVREGAGQLVVAHATEAAPAARTLEPSIPPELDELIARSLRKEYQPSVRNPWARLAPFLDDWPRLLPSANPTLACTGAPADGHSIAASPDPGPATDHRATERGANTF